MPNWGFYLIHEWDGSEELVNVTFLGHETVLGPNQVRIRYGDGVCHTVDEEYFYGSLFVRCARDADLNPRGR